MPDISFALLIVANAALWVALSQIWEERDGKESDSKTATCQ
jgi:hypothetical protein